MTTSVGTATWTFGAEHEWADWPTARGLPPGYGRDRKDITIVNSTGVANDPRDRLHDRGGEINTPPTARIEGQMACLRELREHLPEATINYRSNLHLHIRVPGLRDDLKMLKQVQAHIHEWMPRALPVIEPLELPVMADQAELPGYEEGRRRRLRRMRVSHHSLLRPERLARQMAATTVDEFHAAEVPHTQDGRPQWHLQPRLCVNLRQLRETDTVEFRHWPGTMDTEELSAALVWCETYMLAALTNRPIDRLLENAVATGMRFPRFLPYDHWLEERYRRTVHDGSIPRDQLPINIAKVLEEARHAGRG